MKSHITPRFIVDRIGNWFYWKMNPNLPWLTKKANKYLDNHLKKEMIGLEFGSGRSSMWFAGKLKQLISVEGHEGWYNKVALDFKNNNVENVDYIFSKFDEKTEENAEEYSDIVSRYDDEYFDFILVDGGPRDLCAIKSLPKLKPGGILVIDNLNWFLPSNTRSPNSRSLADGCSNETWQKVYDVINTWEKIWTSSGVTDTGIFIKPKK